MLLVAVVGVLKMGYNGVAKIGLKTGLTYVTSTDASQCPASVTMVDELMCHDELTRQHVRGRAVCLLLPSSVARLCEATD